MKLIEKTLQKIKDFFTIIPRPIEPYLGDPKCWDCRQSHNGLCGHHMAHPPKISRRDMLGSRIARKPRGRK